MAITITTDPAVYSVAVRLAVHYQVSAWEVAFSHLTASFAEEKISPSAIAKRMDQHRMRDILFGEDVKTLGRKMVDVIRAFLDAIMVGGVSFLIYSIPTH